MSLNESIVEDAALDWFGELGYAVGHGPHLAPGEPAAELGIERGTPRLQTGGRAMKPRLPIPTGLRHSAQQAESARLPWVTRLIIFLNPNGVASLCAPVDSTPLGLGFLFPVYPG